MRKIKVSYGRMVFEVINVSIMFVIICLTLYPFLYMLVASVSGRDYIHQGHFGLIPKDFNLDAYKYIFQYDQLWAGYKNTIIYTSLGTIINLFFTVTGAYSLSQKRFKGRNVFMFLIAFTMMFSGGMIPTYLVVSKLNLINTPWAMVLPGAISTWNFIIMRTFFMQLPEELIEAAMIDGSNEAQTLWKIIVPLSMPSIATIGLFYAVGHWNSYFNALIYLTKESLYPLQIIVRQIVIENSMQNIISQGDMNSSSILSESIKFAILIAAALPMICVYPFIQKYFVKGVLIGAIKG